MKKTAIDRIRRFNRFYLPKFDLLGNNYLGSEYSATEARVLFEIYTNDGCTAADIVKTLNIDKSYLSRVIRSHQSNGYLFREVSKTDNRAYILHLTVEGARKTEELINKSNEQIAEITNNLSENDYERLINALDIITELLEDRNENNTL